MITITPSVELLKIGAFSVKTWGFIVALGIIAALFFIFRKAKEKKILNRTEELIAYFAVSALIGGRLAYVAVNPSEFSSVLSLFEIWKGGIISWGVLIGGIAGIFIFKITAKIKADRLFSIVDLCAPYFALASAIGRIGCFLRGCCFGIQTALPWGVIYIEGLSSHQGLGAVHPTQIYHAIADFLIFIVLLRINRKKDILEKKSKKSKYEFFSKKGGVFLLFLALYSAERFFIDFLRWHSANDYIGRITVTQFIFIFIFLISLYLMKKK